MQVQEETYEDSHPDDYATSVYTGPHWMYSYDEYASKPLQSRSRKIHDTKIRMTKREDSLDLPEIRCAKILPVMEVKVKHKGIDSKESRRHRSRGTKQLKKNGHEVIKNSQNSLPYEEQIVSLFCNHCKMTFKAKPTYRRRFNHTLVNHSCQGSKRRQYVLGVKRRKCLYGCNSIQGCIFRTARWKQIKTNFQPFFTHTDVKLTLHGTQGTLSIVPKKRGENSSLTLFAIFRTCKFHVVFQNQLINFPFLRLLFTFCKGNNYFLRCSQLCFLLFFLKFG